MESDNSKERFKNRVAADTDPKNIFIIVSKKDTEFFY